MSLALSLCQYILRPRRGLGQASPSLEAPRLQALETFHEHSRKGKIVMIKTSRYMGLVMGSFLAPETDMIFGDGVGASLGPKTHHVSKRIIFERILQGGKFKSG